MNFGCLSNNDSKGNKSVLSYQMKARFFFNFFAFISYRVLGTAPNFGLKEETEFEAIVSRLEEKLEAVVKNASEEQVQSLSSHTRSHRPLKVHQRQILPLVVPTIHAEKVPVLRTIMHTSC